MIAAVIFDLDGTALDNEHKWEDVFRKVANSHALEYGSKWIHEPGIGVGPNWEKIVGKGERAEKLARQTWNLYWQETKNAGNVQVMAGLEELVRAVKERGWLTALATGTNWNVVESELEQLNLWLAFDVTTTGEEVLAQKPDPEIYTLTAQKLGVEPENCVVIEDSVAGVESAVAAGTTVVGLTSGYASEGQLKKAGVKYVVDSLGEVMVSLGEYVGEKKMVGG
ncbi:MAG: hypothetical protein UY06_C0004G0003 [Candidatus Amesbacteria bacterium GW2011_GWA2_47_70]|uniref:HAD-superfamily hydrolase, subfamily IA, variant 3 n=1 Tax=Candidatus Amesbacteria bacterium GW2011_GWC2_45_19 TaxID=1618366 RepID=A0A0G1Q1W1_9BACT|nr:MAG: hypothetical protein UX05_C0010G0017 [Candidatus Amesbacteria bacterium GW2011_GWC2_45_19]KKU38091.1 MAG: hypothetical protein UX52_C0011G0021 [Candidatus Amesbacteria bacterium GW2011_GWA1_46_35]KKU69064.1 MAG: hypothetical protein UX93_C0003G0056 [Microgenomates group bacterium GW2011_GWC1_47_20]KKU80182.1 MAG: hypothetical protein UY06_C0004G0003 [Candidatus Amesbacteria bacterium GW2011_GWA2_47_70]